MPPDKFTRLLTVITSIWSSVHQLQMAENQPNSLQCEHSKAQSFEKYQICLYISNSTCATATNSTPSMTKQVKVQYGCY